MSTCDGFEPLPHPNTKSGKARRTGVEVEFSGLGMDKTCEVITHHFGGSAAQAEPFLIHVEHTKLGRITVELDTPARHSADNAIVEKGLEIAQAIIPVEVISEPLDREGLNAFNTLIDGLRIAGAAGSRSGILLGFGVHLNPEVVDPNGIETVNTIRAFAFLEHYLRQLEKLDVTRRAMPFVQPWPEEFVTDLAYSDAETLEALFPIIARHITTRNHGLDLFPLLKYVDKDAFATAFPVDKTSARPTFHFRLPDCRIDEPNWDLTHPWKLWHLVETVAASPQMMSELTRAYSDKSTGLFRTSDWTKTVSDILEKNETGAAE